MEWLAAHGKDWGLDPDRMAIGGASAGASVAMGAAITLRDAGKGDLLKAAASLYGVLDYNLDSDSMNELGGGDFMLTKAYTQAVYDDYLPNLADREDPRAFAAKADPAGLPPVFVAAAQLDPIRDDSLTFATMLGAAGHPCELTVYPGVYHAFFRIFGRDRRSPAHDCRSGCLSEYAIGRALIMGCCAGCLFLSRSF